MSEKRKPAYDLERVRAWAVSPAFQVAGSALRTAAELGLSSSEMAAIIGSMKRKHFYKSVTSIHNHREWQDVYHIPSELGVLYVKFRADVVTEFVLLSFKEKGNG